MAVSQNGWTANNRALVSRRQVPGTDVWLTVRNGTAGELLLWTATQIDKRVESIDNGRGGIDDWGYAERPIRGGVELSNHASGTAIDLNAPRHPLGAVNTFNPSQRAEIRKIIAETSGAIRWGGDYVGRKDDMHFEIDTDWDGVIRAWNTIQEKIRNAAQQEEDMPLIPLDLYDLKVGARREITLPWGEAQLVLTCDGGSCRVRVVCQADDGAGWRPMFGSDWNSPSHVERTIRSEHQGLDHAVKLPAKVCKVSIDLIEVTADDPDKFSLSGLVQYFR